MKRFLYIDYLRFIAVIGVISIHVVASLVLNYNKFGHSYWWFGNIIDGGMHWAVPIFVMISGALLLSSKKEEPIWMFYKSRVSRIILPFICSLIFYYIWAHKGGFSSVTLGSALKEMLKGPVYYHLWYVYLIIGLILVTPILKIFVQNCTKQHVQLFLGIWLVSQLDGFIKYFFQVDLGISFRVATDFVGYFVLGYYLHNYEVGKQGRILIYFMGLASLLSIWFGTYHLLKDNGNKFNDFLYQDNSLTITIVSFALFLFVRNIRFNKNDGIVPKLIFTVGKYSYGIYLIHVIVKEVLDLKFHINVLLVHPIVGYIVSLFLILFISLFFVWLINGLLKTVITMPTKKTDLKG